ncbi:hypothetical protein EV356DRAFT_509779 [Viridothelium virens]|uniref:Uncharacterized protein n=1 Tax=Viridothelium virens TaxID=1048519 RepID=A0A6A6HIA3_VIRVR|nr:hypothetical protein EV356DRAFT_509779 [Viridothelium virens]
MVRLIILSLVLTVAVRSLLSTSAAPIGLNLLAILLFDPFQQADLPVAIQWGRTSI